MSVTLGHYLTLGAILFAAPVWLVLGASSAIARAFARIAAASFGMILLSGCSLLMGDLRRDLDDRQGAAGRWGEFARSARPLRGSRSARERR